MSWSISTITPDSFPETLLPSITEHLKDAKAVFIVVMNQDESLWYESIGRQKQYVLWAIECARNSLFKEDE